MAIRTIQVQHLGSDDVTDWYSDVIPQIGETVRLDTNYAKKYRVVDVEHKLWPKIMPAVTIPTIVVAEIASEVPDATQNQ